MVLLEWVISSNLGVEDAGKEVQTVPESVF